MSYEEKNDGNMREGLRDVEIEMPENLAALGLDIRDVEEMMHLDQITASEANATLAFFAKYVNKSPASREKISSGRAVIDLITADMPRKKEQFNSLDSKKLYRLRKRFSSKIKAGIRPTFRESYAMEIWAMKKYTEVPSTTTVKIKTPKKSYDFPDF